MLDLARRSIKACVGICASGQSFDRPIFILAPPRSGSTLLFECLTRFEGTVHLLAEADLVWWRHFPYERMETPSDHIGAEALGDAGCRALCRSLYREAVLGCLKHRRRLIGVRHLIGTEPIRYIDKTIANCFHLDVLSKCFPDARYVFLVRDPRANIASMMEGWPYLERFGKPQLTPILQRIERRTIDHWTYPAPPGWQDIVDRPLAEICAWIWRQHVEAALSFIEREGGAAVRVRYEDLAMATTATIRCLARELDLPWSDAVARYAREAPLSRTAVSNPHPDKWKRRFGDEISAVLPALRGTAERIGYDLTTAPG